MNADNSPELDDGSQLDENARADEDSTADTHSDIGVDDCEPASKVLMHYFRAIVAWNEAYKWLDSSKVFRSPKGVVSLNLVKIQVPKQKNASTSIKDILDEFLQKHKADLDMEKSIRQLEKIGDRHIGTVHAEAILMALIKESSNPKNKLLSSLVCVLKVIFRFLFHCAVC